MTEGRISPLRQRMIEDMNIRHFAANTQEAYIRAVEKLARFLGRSPATATLEELRRFQLHLTRTHALPSTINLAVSALRFFFTATLDRPDAAQRLKLVHQSYKPPVVLSPEEVSRLLETVTSVRYKAALSIAYGAGLRVSEIIFVEGVGHRQRAHVVAGREWQGRQNPTCDALASVAGASTRLVADRATARLAFSRARSNQTHDKASALRRLSQGRSRGRNRQARFAPYLAP